MDDLIAFLRARLDEDEEYAHEAAVDGTVEWSWDAERGYEVTSFTSGYFIPVRICQTDELGEELRHIARHDPARVLADVAAKRQIIDRWSNDAKYPNFDGGYETAIDDVLALLALPYADHPDYDESWRP